MARKLRVNTYTPEQLMVIFRKMKKGYLNGDMSRDEYSRWLEAFKFRDDTGRFWTIGFQSEKWYYHNGKSWTQGMPPSALFSTSETEKPAENTVTIAPSPKSVTVPVTQPAPASSNTVIPPTKVGRPLGIALLAVFYVTIGVAAVIVSTLLFLSPSTIYVFLPDLAPYLASYEPAIEMGAGILGMFAVAMGRGLWKGSGWAWSLSVIFCILGAASVSFSIISGNFYAVASLIVAILFTIYFFRPKVRAFL